MRNTTARLLLGQGQTLELSSADGDTTLPGPPAHTIQAINNAEATFTVLTDAVQTGTQRLTGIGVSQQIHGVFTRVHVATGAVRLYLDTE